MGAKGNGRPGRSQSQRDLTTGEVALLLHQDAATIRRHAERYQMPVVRDPVTGYRRFPRAAFFKWLRETYGDEQLSRLLGEDPEPTPAR
jgi:hypothetical protein